MVTASTSLDRLRQIARPTALIQSEALSEHLHTEVLVVSETFQHTGSFKFRAAFNAAFQSEESKLIAASSGNFGQALAYAAKLLGKQAIIVMPDNSAGVKIDAVRRFGGEVDLVDVNVKPRKQRIAELREIHPEARVLSAYDDRNVIAGNSTLGEEIAAKAADFDCVVVPVGGGGLIAGVIEGLRRAGSKMKVIGAEPALANDASRSLAAGHIIANAKEPQTIADGARTLSLGEENWAVIKDGVETIVEVPDETIVDALRGLFLNANLKVEPTGAVAVGALMAAPERFSARRVVCVVSGGNVDPNFYASLLKSAR